MTNLKEQMAKDAKNAKTDAKLVEDYGYIKLSDGWSYITKRYKDKQGFEAVITESLESKLLDGEGYKIHIKDPQGNLYIINNISKSIASESGKQIDIPSLVEQITSGGSIAEITQRFPETKTRPYPQEFKEKLEKNEELRAKIDNKIEKLKATGKYEGINDIIKNSVFSQVDPYQFKLLHDVDVCLTQHGKQGPYEIYQAGIIYSDKGDVKYVNLSAPRPSTYSGPKKGEPSSYCELIYMDKLLEMGYDKEQAQSKLNELAQQLLDGKPIKDLFLKNREFLEKDSSELLETDMKNQKMKQNTIVTIKRRGLENS